MSKSMGGARVTTWVDENDTLYFKLNTRDFLDQIDSYDVQEAVIEEAREWSEAAGEDATITLESIQNAKSLWVDPEVYDNQEVWPTESYTDTEENAREGWILVYTIDLEDLQA